MPEAKESAEKDDKMLGVWEFYAQVATKAGLKDTEVEKVFSASVDAISELLQTNRKIKLGRIGTVYLVDRDARQGRNPRTGEAVSIPAKTVVKLYPSYRLEEAVEKLNGKAKK